MKDRIDDAVKAELLEVVPLPIALYDADHRLLWANRSYRDLGGKTLSSGQKACRACPVIRTIETGQPSEWEIPAAGEIHPPFREGRWFLCTVPVRDATGGLQGILESAIELPAEGIGGHEALHESRERHYVTLMSVGDGVITTDPEGRVLLLNPEAERLTGWTREEAAGKPLEEIFEIVNEDTGQPVETPLVKILRDKKVVGLANHTLLIARDGTKRSIADSGAPILAPDGEILGIVLVFRDQTEERRQEKTIAEQNRKLSMLISNLPGFVYRCKNDPDWTLLFISEGCRKITGHPPEAFTKGEITYGDLIHPEDRERVWEEVQKALAEGRKFQLEYRIVTKGGEIRWLWEQGEGIPAKDGGIEALEGFIMDITSRKAVEAKLQESRERFDLLVGRLNDVIWRATPDGSHILEVNHAFTTIYGHPEEALHANPHLWLETVHPEDREIAEESDRRLRETGRASAEYRIVRPDGEIRWIRDRKSLIYDEAGNVIEMGGIVADITEEKVQGAQQALLEAQLIQAQKIEAIGRLAGGIAHDFNNMLSVILGHSELAMMKLTSTDPLRARFEEIAKAARRSADLTRQLLAFARKQTIVPRVIDVNDTVSGMLEMLQRLIGENIRIVWKPGGNLWPVHLDPAQLDQILANLAVNARDAIEGAGQIEIATRNVTIDETYRSSHIEATPGDYVLLSVSDDGAGMDRKTLEKIFEPFFTTKEMGKGTGLGLATIHGIVKQNEGFINVYSEPGKGTTFRIYLPRHREGGKERTEEEATPYPRGRGETILVVEDEPTILDTAKELLIHLGYNVFGAVCAEEALHLARRYAGKIDLLLTDVVMPDLDGKELARRIAEIHPGIGVLFMSGYTADIISRHGVLDPGVHLVEKPLRLQDLAVKVAAALRDKAFPPDDAGS